MNSYVKIPRPTKMPEYIEKLVESGKVFVSKRWAAFQEIKENYDEAQLKREIHDLGVFLDKVALMDACYGGIPFSWRDDYEAGQKLYFEMLDLKRVNRVKEPWEVALEAIK